jgi:hypothetical protein
MNPPAVLSAATENPFRPEVRPTLAGSSMRSPVYSSTSARPFAVSVEAGYADQVPLERQGPISMTTNRLVFANPTYGLASNIPPSLIVPRSHVTTLRQAAAPVPWPIPGYVQTSFSQQIAAAPAAAPVPWPIPGYVPTSFSQQIAAAPAGDPFVRRSGVGEAERPPWAVPIFSAETWNGMTPAQRQAAAESNARSTTPGLGSQVLTVIAALGQAGLTAYLQYNQAERDQALALAQQETQRQLANANAQGGGANNEAQQRLLQSMTDMISSFRGQSPLQQPRREGLSQGAIIAIAFGGVALLGGMVFLATRPRQNPSHAIRRRRRRSR